MDTPLELDHELWFEIVNLIPLVGPEEAQRLEHHKLWYMNALEEGNRFEARLYSHWLRELIEIEKYKLYGSKLN